MPTPQAQPPYTSQPLFGVNRSMYEDIAKIKQLERALGMATEQNAKLKTEIEYLAMHNESLKYELKKENEALIRELKIELTLKEEIQRLQEQNTSFQGTIKKLVDQNNDFAATIQDLKSQLTFTNERDF